MSAGVTQEEGLVRIDAKGVPLEGNLIVPQNATGLIVFAHGSGSSRFSSRNRYVAQILRDGGLGTLLIDLLSPAEEAVDLRTAHLRFDIDLLADRVICTLRWLAEQRDVAILPIGLFGASTGAAAALVAAGREPDRVKAVVSRGGRPDLADRWLPKVKAPTLLIVGGNDTPVIQMNQEAARLLKVPKELVIVPGATHLFEEPGALDHVARLARDWFAKYLK